MVISNLKSMMKKRNISVDELAERVGCRRETIIRISRNSYIPSIDLAYRLSEALCCHLGSLFHFHTASEFDDDLDEE